MHIFCFIFLLMNYYLLFLSYIYILDYGNGVRQKENSRDFFFLFKFKMGHKAAETTHNINYAFDSRTVKKYTVQWWFKKFGKGDESLEDEEAGHWKLTMTSWKQSMKVVLSQLHKKLPKNSTSTILWSFSI